jgi:hypothetical protein
MTDKFSNHWIEAMNKKGKNITNLTGCEKQMRGVLSIKNTLCN